MARAPAARVKTHAHTVWGAYRFDEDGEKSLTDLSWLRPLAFAVSAVCLVCLTAFVISLTTRCRINSSSRPINDLDLFARAVSQDLHDKIKTDAQKPLGEPLNQIVPQGALARGRRILVTDEHGRVAAAFPPIASKDLTLSQAIGAEEALIDFTNDAEVCASLCPMAFRRL